MREIVRNDADRTDPRLASGYFAQMAFRSGTPTEKRFFAWNYFGGRSVQNGETRDFPHVRDKMDAETVDICFLLDLSGTNRLLAQADGLYRKILQPEDLNGISFYENLCFLERQTREVRKKRGGPDSRA